MNNRNQLTRRDPQGLGKIFESYARDFFSPYFDESGSSEFLPKVEIKETKKGYLVLAELPGLSEDDIELSLDGNSLVLQGERRDEKVEDEEGRWRSEMSYGRFYRSIPLGDDVDNETISARYDKGILKIELTKKNDGEGRRRRIPINKTGTKH